MLEARRLKDLEAGMPGASDDVDEKIAAARLERERAIARAKEQGTWDG